MEDWRCFKESATPIRDQFIFGLKDDSVRLSLMEMEEDKIPLDNRRTTTEVHAAVTEDNAVIMKKCLYWTDKRHQRFHENGYLFFLT